MTHKLEGKTFGRWTVLENVGSRNNSRLWKCLCACGTEKLVVSGNLVSGASASCGCLTVESTRKRSTTHGHTKDGKLTPEYQSWKAMLKRCTEVNGKSYVNYGGRGIKVCERWSNSFEDFFEDIGEKPTLKHTLDRIDVNGNYEPSNCKWSTYQEQSRNQRLSKRNTSGVRGVAWNKRDKRWVPTIKANGISIRLGSFTDKEKAIEARKQAELKYWKKSS
jgi:hypothetical protein